MTYINSHSYIFDHYASIQTFKGSTAQETDASSPTQKDNDLTTQDSPAIAQNTYTSPLANTAYSTLIAQQDSHANRFSLRTSEGPGLDYTSDTGATLEIIEAMPDPVASALSDDPDAQIAQYQSHYDAFMAKAKQIYKTLQAKDPQGYLNFKVTSFGATASLNNDVYSTLSNRQRDEALQLHDQVSEELRQINQSFLPLIRDAMPYLQVKAEIDYIAKTGVTRDNLETPEQKTEFTQRVQHYARNAFGINAPSYAQIDAAATHGYWLGYPTEGVTPDGYEPPKKHLPNVSA